MSKNTYPLKLPTSVKKAAAELAATDGVSLNQFIAAAVAEKVGSLRAADDFLRERAGSAKPKDMLKYLRRAPKVAPNADDMPLGCACDPAHNAHSEATAAASIGRLIRRTNIAPTTHKPPEIMVAIV
jgi:hypothetical protein